MRQSHNLLVGLLPWLAAASPVVGQAKNSDNVSNANHIFNSVHDSMRQFGSSLNHNGMGVFIATVPQGTEFYHGTSSPYRVNGTEWLAFEPEHALIFARSRGPPPGRGGPGGRPGGGPPGEGPPGRGPPGEDKPGHGPPPPDTNRFEDGHHADDERPQSQERPNPKFDLKMLKHKSKKDDCSGKGNDDHAKFTGHLPHVKSGQDDDVSRELHEASPREHHQGPPPDAIKDGNRHHDKSPPPPPGRLGGFLGAIGRFFGHQSPLHKGMPAPSPEDEGRPTGYLHTYRTKHALRLVYLDGQSAAKSTKGTLDVQDMIIRNTFEDGSGRGMFGEKERADEMCRIANKEWQGKIDGILRMEGGFEVILCSFEKDLDVVRIMSTKSGDMGPGGGGGEDSFNYYQSIATRYDDIGADRVKLDYGNFVSLFAYPDALYFDKTNRPRVRNDSAEMEVIRKDIKTMVLGPDSAADTVNWQDITDLIVGRYADRIEYMASGELQTAKELKDDIERALRPFIDYSARNASLEAERCASQFWPAAAATTASEKPSTAQWAVKETYQNLCSSLALAAQEKEYKKALAMITGLKESLAWTTWKKCRGCHMHEICLLPIWPMGSEEDFVQPKCASAKTIGSNHGGYWGGFGGPPPRHG